MLFHPRQLGYNEYEYGSTLSVLYGIGSMHIARRAEAMA